MAPKLISTLGEVQEHVPVAMTSSFSVVAPYLVSAERTYIRKLIGEAQYSALAGACESNPVDEMAEALDTCRQVITNLGYYLAMPVLSVSVSDAGVQINTSENTKNAFQWQVEDLKDSLIELGFLGIENLLELLDANPDTFSEYHESAEYADLHNSLIISASDFDRHYDIGGSQFVFSCLTRIMKRVEAQTIERALGKSLYAELKAGNLAGKQAELVEGYLKPALTLLTASKAFVERVITLKDGKVAFNFKGNYNNIKESMPASRDQVKDLRDQLDADGSAFLSDGLMFIANNPGDFENFAPALSRRRARFNNSPDKGLFGV
jgi:hypothetical protein